MKNMLRYCSFREQQGFLVPYLYMKKKYTDNTTELGEEQIKILPSSMEDVVGRLTVEIR